MRKILHKPYKISVKVAKKLTNLDNVLIEKQNLYDENQNLRATNFELIKRLKTLEKKLEFGYPSGHYYSPIHKINDLKKYEMVANRSKKEFTSTIPAFSEKKMIKQFNDLKTYFKDFNYADEDDGKCRFYTNNFSYPLLDSLILYSMIRKNKPKRIIEIGSGYSSGLMMDINEKYFDNKIDINFIEPYPQILRQRMLKTDRLKYKIIPKGVQNVSLDIFKQLKNGDLLFIDSTHVSKFNSDVNYELFYILPELNQGVIIHFHDIFDGFEYPLGWLKKGWAWNEDYLLRTFLMYNNEYRVLLMSNYLQNHHQGLLKKSYSQKDVLFGGSLWMKKL